MNLNNTFNFSTNISPINKPAITYYFETNPNTNTVSDLNNSPKNNNLQIDQQKSYEPHITSHLNSIDKYKLQIIEKDKLLIELKKKEKDLNKEIANLKFSLSSKDDEIFRLEDKLQEYLHNLKNSENQTEKKLTEFSEISKNYNEKINSLMAENQNLKNKINNLNSVIETHEGDLKNIYFEKEKNEEEIKYLRDELKKKENMIDINYSKQQVLLNENKQLPSLKAKIDDLEKIIL